jgi:hypothetical protein
MLWAALGLFILGAIFLLAAVGLNALWRQPKRSMVDALSPELSSESQVTRDRQARALSLYERNGFKPVAPFGDYVGSPLSVCLSKDV